MLKHPTLDQLHALGIHGMAKAFVEIAAASEAEGLGNHEWLGLLLDREAWWLRDKRLAARLRHAKLRQQASIEDVDYRSQRGLERALFQKLTESQADMIIGAGPKGVIISYVDRKSKYTKLAKFPDKSADSVVQACGRILSPLADRIETITYDNVDIPCLGEAQRSASSMGRRLAL